MASKYAAVFPKLSDLPPDPSRQQIVEEVKKNLIEANDNKPINGLELAKRYSYLRKEKNRLKSELSDNELALEAIQQMLLENSRSNDPAWGAYGVPKSTILLPTGERVRIEPEVYCVTQDRDLNRQWAIKAGLERLLTINWQVLNALTKERLIKGEPEPEGVKAWINYKFVYAKAGSTGEE